MCVGMAVMFGPPTLGAGCWYMWHVGRDRMLRMKRISKEAAAAATSGVAAGSASLLTIPLAYAAQLRFVVTHFDEGGALSLNWKKTTDSLGEPLKIKTWTQFYRAAGPPVFARTAAIVASCYAAGAMHAWVVARSLPPPLPPPKNAKKPHRK